MKNCFNSGLNGIAFLCNGLIMYKLHRNPRKKQIECKVVKVYGINFRRFSVLIFKKRLEFSIERGSKFVSNIYIGILHSDWKVWEKGMRI